MVSLPGRPVSVVVILASLGLASQASAEEELRISILSKEKTITLSARDLAIFDADRNARIAWRSGKGELRMRSGSKGISILGTQVAREPTAPPASKVLIEARSGIRVNGRLFLGRIEITRRGSSLRAINRLPLETYLLGIVGSEMNAAWPAEALKAQAVAARTYAMQRRMRMRAANKPFDLDSSVLSQVYTGAERITPSVVQAVLATRGEVMAFRHGLVEALFHSTCGGETVSAKEAFGKRVPYLQPRRCGYCAESKSYRWKMDLPLSEVSRRLSRAKLVRGPIDRFDKRSGGDSVQVAIGRKRRSLAPRKVRAALGYTVLRSARFVAKTRGSRVEFEGRGFGHGVGLCQWGAKGLSDRGKSYREILEHYYPGTGIKRLY